ncbi:MAG: hypothetical protein DRQ49_16305, partial [Gammaproteobacteria bacterium]
IEKKIESLSEDYDFIKEHDDKILKHDSIYDEFIYPDLMLWEFLYSNKGKNIFSRDIKKFLLKIIDHSESTNRTVEEIIQRLDKHHEATIYGLLCLHEVKSIEEKYLVYNRHNWFAFHRYFLGQYPISENHFYHECQKYFSQLFFHERVEKTLKDLEKSLHDFSKIIVHHLTLLNDEFCKYYNQSNRIDSLKNFSSACNVDASPQGNAKDKPKMTFEFVNDSNIKEFICCEPHLKLGKSDDSGNSHYYFNRIYFHEGKENIANGKILIAHIGKHIQFD